MAFSSRIKVSISRIGVPSREEILLALTFRVFRLGISYSPSRVVIEFSATDSSSRLGMSWKQARLLSLFLSKFKNLILFSLPWNLSQLRILLSFKLTRMSLDWGKSVNSLISLLLRLIEVRYARHPGFSDRNSTVLILFSETSRRRRLGKC